MKIAVNQISRAALLCSVWLLFISHCPAQGLTSKVDEYMSTAIKRSRFSGSILVARDGQVLVSRGYGMANLEDEVSNTPQTKFRLGSLTKQFTAVAVLMLQERGALRVQDSVCNYLPQCPGAWQPITIHHLLTHTSGIQNSDYTETIKLPMSAANTIERLKNKPLEFVPGRLFRPSNSNYILLGHIIEKVSGQSYDAFVRENIFKPLRMTNTDYDYPRRILKHRAAGYSLRGDTLVNALYIDMSVPYSAGGLYSTVEDLYLWDQALYTEKLVSKKSLAMMFTPFKGNYGYGWYIAEQDGHRFISHSGWIDGFAASFARYTDDHVTVIVLSNMDSAPVNTLARNIGAIVLGLRHDTLEERRAVKIDSKIYDAYVGQYELAPNFIITITKEGNKLMGQATGHPLVELFPESENEFFIKEFDAKIKFVKSDRGPVTHSVVSLNGWDTQAKKIEPLPILQ
jgi:CubicO group peptidase (beta-lactamase class C family)